MGSITRYILGQLVTLTIFVTIGLTFAIWLTQSLRLIDYMVNRGLPATTFFAFVALLLPSFLGIVLPIAAFCAVLFIYNKLLMESELVVLRAAGVSHFGLARPAIILGLGTMALVYLVSLYLLPLSYRNFKDLQNEIRNDHSAVLLQEGVFNTISDGITVYVRERGNDGELRGILVHDNRDELRPVTMMAERGALVASDTGPRVVMVNGNRQEFNRDDGQLSLLYFDSYTVELDQLGDNAAGRWREPKERYIHELLWPDSHPASQRFYRGLIAEGHQRLIGPLYTVTFVLVALAALLTGEFNRRGQTRRIMVAMLCVAALEGLTLSLQDLAGRHLEIVPAMYAGAILPLITALVILARNPRRRAQLPVAAEAAAQ